ncbi:hypothetical protein F7R91_14715 [Streptomyces luteolifulvus]|uniref:Mobile element protein n=1 Tax=Streptomyces luteolifulvus TaxID=2615112 RepID=A0A6H9V3B4_9ACTN|nr:hypothetical protein [Streptomyces luteolifulvus]KAB1146826.1 hypothetical protein F7R91_14715 [Streptomyces luteolifulvus]
MALPPFATAAELDAATQSTIPAATADLALASASAVIRRWTRQDITRVADDVVTLRVIDECELVLPQRPVVSVAQVRVNSLVLSDWVLSGDRLLRTGGWRHLPGTTTYPDPGLVEVTYTHGWDEIPGDVRAVCLDLAAMTVTNPSGLRSVAIDDYSRTYATETLGAGTLSTAHKEMLTPYRRRIGTVTLR